MNVRVSQSLDVDIGQVNFKRILVNFCDAISCKAPENSHKVLSSGSSFGGIKKY